MQFSRGGEPIGGVVSNFLLEKVRDAYVQPIDHSLVAHSSHVSLRKLTTNAISIFSISSYRTETCAVGFHRSSPFEISWRHLSEQYALSQTLTFQYINQGQAIRTSKIDDAKAMHETEVLLLKAGVSSSSHGQFLVQHAMDIVGLSKDVQMLIFRSLAGILHLGNVQFGDRENYADVLSEQGTCL